MCRRTNLLIDLRTDDKAVHGKDKKQCATDISDGTLGDARGEHAPADNGDASAQRVAEHGAEADAERVLCRSHGNSCDLAAVTPLGEKGDGERVRGHRPVLGSGGEEERSYARRRGRRGKR